MSEQFKSATTAYLAVLMDAFKQGQRTERASSNNSAAAEVSDERERASERE